jgi:hypothetical protein
LELPLVFNSRVLALHVPKTGGNSLSVYLLQTLARPIVYQSWHPRTEIDHDAVTFIQGNPHISLREAATLTRDFGMDLSDFAVILVVMRNPYELEVSRYESFRQQAHDPALSTGDHELARTLDFPGYIKAFLAPNGVPRSRKLEEMVSIDGKIPANLRYIRYEHLVPETNMRLREVGIAVDGDFPWLNQSIHAPAESYYTPRAEKIVYQAHRWMFDQGLYDRLPSKTQRKRNRVKNELK